MEIIKEKTIAFTGNRSLTSPSGLRGTHLNGAICNKLYELLEKEYLENGITGYELSLSETKVSQSANMQMF